MWFWSWAQKKKPASPSCSWVAVERGHVPTDQLLAVTLQQALSTCWKLEELTTQKPQRELQKVTPPSANRTALQLRFPLKMTLKDLPAQGLDSPCSLEREKMIPRLP